MQVQVSRASRKAQMKASSLRRAQLLVTRPVAPTLRHRATPIVAMAGKDNGGTGNAMIDTVLDVGRGIVNSASDLVPESVPRPVAKGGVAVIGGLVAFWLLQKVVSTVLTFVLLGGAAYLYFKSSSRDSDGGSGGGSGGGRGRGDDASDPLSDARRIMDKYR